MAIRVQNNVVISDARELANITNLKTVNNESILGTGDIEASSGGAGAGGTEIKYALGSLVHTLNNPNAYGTAASDNFGFSVAISGNYAIVGTYREDDSGGSDSGKAYIFNVTTGALLHTLNNPNAYGTSASDQFGIPVAISGNYAIVGAPGEDDSGNTFSGKAYIFNVTTGALLHTLNNPNAYGTAADDNFGYSVAISGNYAIVGAYGESDSGGSFSGKAYIFNVTTGALLRTLNNPNDFGTSPNDSFGSSVAISGNYAIVSANLEDDSSSSFSNSGRVYIFNITTGALLHTLNNPNPYDTTNGDRFGLSVSISGNYAIVGTPFEDDAGGIESGKAYIFDVTTGALVHTLNNPNAYGTAADDNFGYSVSISGNYAIVGTQWEDEIGNDQSGKAYIFDVTTGALVHTLNNPNAYSIAASDRFGESVAISGNYAIVGAYLEDDSGGSASGKAYIFAVADVFDFFSIEEIKFANDKKISSKNPIFDIAYSGGELVHTINNPNAYGTSSGDEFTNAIDISGNYAIVGAWQEDEVGNTASGKAYIFDVTTGALLHTLNNPNVFFTPASDNFGVSVSISGNRAIVGASGEDDSGGDNSGKAYIFDAINGRLLHTLGNPNAYGTSINDRFGVSVSISGNYAIVGAYFEDESGNADSGKAYIFDVSTGALLHTLNNPNAYGTAASDRFGYSVDISGNYAIVGTLNEDEDGQPSSGKAYIFNVTTGALLHTLNNPNAYDTPANDNFGESISISGNRAIVGAYQEDEFGNTESGKAYIFDVTTGALLHTLNNPNAYGTPTNDFFGIPVAISGNYAIVGAQYESEIGNSFSGKAYIFNVTTGALVHTLNNPNAYGTAAGDQFGSALGISGNYAMVGSKSEDDSSGKAYIFSVTNHSKLEKLLTKVGYYSK